MALRVLTEGLGLAEPLVRVDTPTWVWGQTLHLEDNMSLFVIYRSTWLRDSDKGYEQVQTILDRSECKELYRATREDEAMFHGSAEWIVYLLNPVENPSTIAHTVIELVKGWGEPMHPIDVPGAIHAKLQSLEGVRR